MTKKEREQFEFIQRTVMVLASAVALKRPAQVRIATEILARECGVAMPRETAKIREA
ncbi:MAG: hypothetical protein M9932_11700 [Xanthobacteraceae bacterium]|nr:hypothetical protein [Xanthobacteraceae bacterium]